MIYNKSAHPVEIKKISIRLWTLRDEIEAAIGRRMKECEAAGVPLYIDDIKRFYNLNPEAPLTQQGNVLQMPSKGPDASGDEGINSLMESIAEDAAPAEAEAAPAEEAPAPEAAPVEGGEAQAAAPVEGGDAAAPAADASKTFNEAEEIIAEQKLQGMDLKKPNPILDRPYQRQPPDLDKISYGFCFLSDINMEHLLTFTKDKYLQGQNVIVEFLIPQNFSMTAQIVYCHHYARTSKIISSTKPDYRVQCKFSYQRSGERDTLRNFLKSIEPMIPTVAKKPKKEAEEDSLGF